MQKNDIRLTLVTKIKEKFETEPSLCFTGLWDMKNYKDDMWLRHVVFVQRFGASYHHYRYYDGEEVETKVMTTKEEITMFNDTYLGIAYDPRNEYQAFTHGYIKDWTVCGKY